MFEVRIIQKKPIARVMLDRKFTNWPDASAAISSVVHQQPGNFHVECQVLGVDLQEFEHNGSFIPTPETVERTPGLSNPDCVHLDSDFDDLNSQFTRDYPGNFR